MSPCRKIAEGGRRDSAIAAGLHIVLCSPGTCIQFVIEGIVIRTREVGQHLELNIRRRR
jgi:hypothetical protein